MEYKHPALAILGLALLVLWTLDYWNLLKKVELTIPGAKDQAPLLRRFSRWPIYLAGVVGWLFISFSLTGPRNSLKFEKNKIDIVDIMIVFDVSRSMLADDFSPNRLEVAKAKVIEFVKTKTTDRVGLIIFSEKPFTLLPFTTDFPLIAKVISQIDTGFLGSGTNIGDALALAVARNIRSEAKRKVIVLLTDGVNNVGNIAPLEAAKKAQESEIKVYTIGVGKDNNARLPVNGPFGTTYTSIPGGGIDVPTMKEISRITGGKFYMASDSNALANVFDEIGKLEKTKIEQNSQVVYDEKYHFYLLVGVLLFMATEVLRRFYLREAA